MQLAGRFSVPNTITKDEYDDEDVDISLHGLHPSHLHRGSIWDKLRVSARAAVEVWICILVGPLHRRGVG